MPDELLRLTDNVWYFPLNPVREQVEPSVGVITMSNQTVLIDAGNSPGHARRILAALEKIHAPPISHIIYTHHHWDHVFGASVFGVPAIGHTLCRESLLEGATKPWGAEYLKDEIRKNPRLNVSYTAIGNAIEDWSEFRIVPPVITFSNKMELHLDGLTLSMEHVEGEHSPDSIVVFVRGRGVIFLGDCYYVPPLHLRTPQSRGSPEIIKSLVTDESIKVYVDGHNLPLTREQVLNIIGSAPSQEDVQQ